MSVTVRERKRVSGKITLYLDIYQDGHRTFENLDIHLNGEKEHDKEKRRIAKEIRAQRELEQHGNRYNIVTDHKRKVELVTYLQEQIQKRKDQGAKKGQLNIVCSTMQMIRRYARSPVQIASISPQWLQGFQTFLLQNVKPVTAARYYTVVRAGINRAMKDGIITINPCKRVDQIKFPESQRTYLTIEEVRRLSETVCDYAELKRAFLFSVYTGLRISDVEALRWEQIVNGQLEFRQQKTGTFEYFPLSDQAKQLLGEPKSIDTAVFDLPIRKVMGYQLVKWAHDAGLAKHVTFHIARHTFATLALTSGADVYTVSKLLGHSNINTTQIYAKVVDAKKLAAVNMMPGLSSQPKVPQTTEPSAI